MSLLIILIYLGKSGLAFIGCFVGSFGGIFSGGYFSLAYSLPLMDARSAKPTEPARA